MKQTANFYESEIRVGVESILRRRLLAVELEVARERHAKQHGQTVLHAGRYERQQCLESELLRSKARTIHPAD